jgi:hypothetical protein
MWGFDHMAWMNGWAMGFGLILWIAILALIIAVACSFTAYSVWSASLHGARLARRTLRAGRNHSGRVSPNETRH